MPERIWEGIIIQSQSICQQTDWLEQYKMGFLIFKNISSSPSAMLFRSDMWRQLGQTEKNQSCNKIHSHETFLCISLSLKTC